MTIDTRHIPAGIPVSSDTHHVVIPDHGPEIESESLAVLAEIRDALSKLIAGLSKPVLRAVDLERILELDKKLAWQIFRVVHAPHPLAEIQNLPAPSSVRRLLEAASRHGVSGNVIKRLSAAFDRFESFTLVHARDRESLISMLNGLGGTRDDQYELKVRKSYFRAAAHLWGIHARMVVRTGIVHAKPGPHFIEDSVAIQASIGLERVRVSQATDIVMAMRTISQPPPPGTDILAPIHHPPEMLADFCTGPLPDFSPYPEGEVQGETKLRLPPGRTGAATLYSMQLHENTATTRQPDYFGRTLLTMPTEEMVWELLVPAGWTVPTTVRAATYGCREHPERTFSEQAGDLMSQQESVEYLGQLDRVPALPGSTGHSEAITHVLKRLGWFGTRFDVYRARVYYPIMHTLLSLRVDAPRIL